ncbi:hypothetical protein VTK26DRAFT_4264 [Humicola hyalothermophila]
MAQYQVTGGPERAKKDLEPGDFSSTQRPQHPSSQEVAGRKAERGPDDTPN